MTGQISLVRKVRDELSRELISLANHRDGLERRIARTKQGCPAYSKLHLELARLILEQTNKRNQVQNLTAFLEPVL